MRRGQSVSDTSDDVDSLGPGNRRAKHAISKCFALEKLHHCEIDVICRTNVVNRQDIRVADGSYRSCLTLKSKAGFFVSDEMRLKNLDRNAAIEAAVVAAINFTHSASAQRANDFVVSESSSFQESHGLLLSIGKGSREC